MKTGENISNTKMFLEPNEMLTVNCYCWDDKSCTGNIEISEIIEKDSTDLNICCEIAVESAVKCVVTDANVSANANVNANANANANANVDSNSNSTDKDADASANSNVDSTDD